MRKLAGIWDVPSRKGWLIAAAALLAQLWLLGNVCRAGIDKFVWDAPSLARQGVILVSAFVVLYILLTELVRLLEGSPREGHGWISRAAALLERHPVAVPMAIVLACWLPWLIIAWPGTTDPNDNLDQLRQWHGIMTGSAQSVGLKEGDMLINSHHPVFHTMLINLCVDLGAALGSQNLGMFLYVAAQELLLSWSLALCHALMCRMGTPAWVRVVSVLIWSLCPVYGGWALSLTKDLAFTVAMLQLVLCLMCAVRRPSALREGRWLLVSLFFSTLLACLFRNNGLYCVLPAAVALFCARGPSRVSVACCAAVVVSMLVSLVLYPVLGVTPGSKREMLSVPFQQTARYLQEHPDDVTDEERAAIDAVLPYDELSESYKPDISDPVKGKYRIGSDEHLPAYFAAWAQMGLRHPGTYVAATLSNTYKYFFPGLGAGWFWLNLNCWNVRDTEDGVQDAYDKDGFHLHQVEALKPVRNAAIDLYATYRATNIISCPGDMAFCAWVLLIAAFLIARTHRWRMLVPLLPLLALYATVILGPQNGNIRYMLPIIESMPLVVAWLMDAHRGGREERAQ